MATAANHGPDRAAFGAGIPGAGRHLRSAAGWAVTAGLAVGLGLGFYGVSLTSLDLVDGNCSYLPNPWIAGALSLLLIGRLAWRFLHGGLMQPQAGTGVSPLTLGFAATLIGYYFTYSIVLLMRMRRLVPQPA